MDRDRRWAGGPSPLARAGDDVYRLAERVAEEAVRDGKLAIGTSEPERMGCVFGASKGELRPLLENSASFDGELCWTDYWPNGPAARLAGRFGCDGPVLAPIAACATGLVACIRAAELIRSDVCDVVLAGSADASLFPAAMSSFQRLGVLAGSGDEPATACRPFDRKRTGFLIGEGAACLVLERKSHAERRGVPWYGEWLAGRLGSDPSGLMRVDETGATLARLLADALADCDRTPDYINLHGTATVGNDLAECRAVRRVFGPAADAVSCSGVKGSFGHLLGAAGSVELALTLLALRDQIVPPTVNLTDLDPDCRLDLTPVEPRRRKIDATLKISSGFGGHLAMAAIGRGER